MVGFSRSGEGEREVEGGGDCQGEGEGDPLRYSPTADVHPYVLKVPQMTNNNSISYGANRFGENKKIPYIATMVVTVASQ